MKVSEVSKFNFIDCNTYMIIRDYNIKVLDAGYSLCSGFYSDYDVDSITFEPDDNTLYIDLTFGSNWDVIVNYMDDEIREKVYYEFAPCSQKEFFDRYCSLHPGFKYFLVYNGILEV